MSSNVGMLSFIYQNELTDKLATHFPPGIKRVIKLNVQIHYISLNVVAVYFDQLLKTMLRSPCLKKRPLDQATEAAEILTSLC